MGEYKLRAELVNTQLPRLGRWFPVRLWKLVVVVVLVICVCNMLLTAVADDMPKVVPKPHSPPPLPHPATTTTTTTTINNNNNNKSKPTTQPSQQQQQRFWTLPPPPLVGVDVAPVAMAAHATPTARVLPQSSYQAKMAELLKAWAIPPTKRPSSKWSITSSFSKNSTPYAWIKDWVRPPAEKWWSFDNRRLPVQIDIVWSGLQGGLSYQNENLEDPMRWLHTHMHNATEDAFASCSPDQPRFVLELGGHFRTFDSCAQKMLEWLDMLYPPVCWAVTLGTWLEIQSTTVSWWGGGGEHASQFNNRTATDVLPAMQKIFRNRLAWAIVDANTETTKNELKNGRTPILWTVPHEMVYLGLPEMFHAKDTIVMKARPDMLPSSLLNLTNIVPLFRKTPQVLLMMQHSIGTIQGADPSPEAWLTTVAGQELVLLMSRFTFMQAGKFEPNMRAWERCISSGPLLKTAYGNFGWQMTRLYTNSMEGYNLKIFSGFKQPDAHFGFYQDVDAECRCTIARCYWDIFPERSEACSGSARCGGFETPISTVYSAVQVKMMTVTECFSRPVRPNCDPVMHTWYEKVFDLPPPPLSHAAPPAPPNPQFV